MSDRTGAVCKESPWRRRAPAPPLGRGLALLPGGLPVNATGGTVFVSRQRITQRAAVETTVDAALRRTWKFMPMMRELGVGGEVPTGPWDDEPDKIQWVDALTDLDCLMLRNHMGGWCGYVGVPRKHPLHGLDYGMPYVQVHGGLTFADRCSPGEPIDGICHIALPGREEQPWWFGFDCGHYMDAQPMDYWFAATRPGHPFNPVTGTYRDERYVSLEVADLARQLAAAA